MTTEQTTEEANGEQESRGIHDAKAILAAFGAAWTTFTLYPNPGQQGAFKKAVGELARFTDGGPIINVGAGSFGFRGAPIRASRDGLDRLASQFFIHDTEAFRLLSAPSSKDLVALFEILSEEAGPEGSSVADRLADAGVESIGVWAHGLLGMYGDDREDGYDDGWGEDRSVRRSRIAELAELGVDAEFMVGSLKELCGGDADLLAKYFVDAFTELHTPDPDVPDVTVADLGDALMPYLADDMPPSPLNTFVDAFRLLEGDDRLRVFERFLDSVDDATHRLFVDQFGGDELGSVADELDKDYSDALLQYVRESLDQPDGDFDDLLPPLHSAEDVAEMRRDASDRIADLLEDRSRSFDPDADGYTAIREELSQPFGEGSDIEILRRLFVYERRPHRFRRVVRIWTGRISDAMRSGDYATACEIVAAIQDDPPYAADDRHMVEEGLGDLISEDLLDAMWETKDRKEQSDLPDLVTALGAGAIDTLVEELAGEENAGRRKVLVELLGGLAARNVRPIATRLNDKRWYVVRNLATVLGKSQNPGAAKPLRSLADHSDHRVRVEALRALVPLEPDGASDVLIGLLSDTNHRVRQTALTYLRNGDRPVSALVEAIDRGDLESDVARAVVHIIARQRTPEAFDALKRLGGKRVAMRGIGRTVRHAAREAMKATQ